ncbi:MAG: hypothetical protein CVT63_05975 [Candidatus Anoxymicrobium japonicum]|uniref:LUD domain-containing protein n=1 Tax=Candidatus Anoxymicrobium japonicum TaxID=2013648 RepID=A0A2N3G523_9ACTN|nr:MAG: hypothetical protein CVT63_05975 [Candidatus Anoxymicrobium japonicum]
MPADIDESILEMWDDFHDERVRKRVLVCASALADRNFSVAPVPTASEANRRILNHIPIHKTVLYWDTAILEELGIISTLQARGNKMKNAMRFASERRSRRGSLIPAKSVYLSTACAVTMDGMLVKVEPEFLPVFGPGRTPDTIILVMGFNHIVNELEDAFRRVRDTCVPQRAKQMGLEIDCAKSQLCVECAAPPAMCAVNTVVTRQPAAPDIVIILIGERGGKAFA